MNSKTKLGVFVAAGIGLLVLIIVIVSTMGVDWSETYIKDKDHAKGTYYVAKLLQHYQPQSDFIVLDSPIHESLSNRETPSNYLFIGTEIYLPDDDLDALNRYVHSGNNAFLFCDQIPYELMEVLAGTDTNLYTYLPLSYAYSNGISNRLSDSNLNITADSAFEYDQYGFSNRSWNYIAFKDLDSIHAETLGTLKITLNKSDFTIYNSSDSTGIETKNDTLFEGANYVRIPYGKGYYYFHTNPILFCNAHLTERANLDYINGVFAYLNTGDILWEEHNWVFSRPYLKTYVPRTNTYSPDESILKMILENQELKWGWYSLLIMAIMFVIFNGKRKQATIPLLPDVSNTTLIQIKKVGHLYTESEEYFEITQDMFENFLWFVHFKLNIDTHQSSERIIRDLIKQTDYDADEMKSIFTRYKKIENWKSVTHGVFLQLHRDIEKFYSSLK